VKSDRRVAFTAKDKVTVEDFEIPNLNKNEVLIKTKSALISERRRE